MQQCLSTDLPVFSRDVNDKGAKSFVSCGYEHFIMSYYKSRKTRHLYELLQFKKPTKVYFDVDISASNVADTTQSSFDAMLVLLREFTKSKLSVEEPHLYVLDATTDRKFSKHIIIDVFLQDVENVSMFVSDFFSKHRDANDIVQFIDTSVYTRNRSFRLIHSAKYGKTNTFKLDGNDAYSEADVCNTMIQNYFPMSYSGKLKKLVPSNANVFSIKTYVSSDSSSSGQSLKRQREDTVHESLHSSELPDDLNDFFTRRSYTVRSVRKHLDKDVIDLIIGGAKCPWVNGHHKHNNQYFTITNGVGWWKCADPDCRRIRYGAVNMSFVAS